MATNVKFLRGLSTKLPATGVDGYFYLTTDTHELKVAIGEAIVKVNEEVVYLDSTAQLPSVGKSKTLYYIHGQNILSYWDATTNTYGQINPDTGAIEFEVTGTGNAITDVSYDATTRKLTLTKGTVFATKAELSTLDSKVTAAKPDVYEVTSDSVDLSELTTGINGKPGDLLLVTNSQGVRSAYYYNDGTDENTAIAEAGWVACSGNVAADSVILTKDITFAGNYESVGNISKGDTYKTSGKSLADVLTKVFTQVLNPSITAYPEVTLTLTGSGWKEVGTSFSPSYSASLSAGSYTYGPSTGITAKTWSISDSNGGSGNTSSGSFTSFTVNDDTNYTVSATATYDAGTKAYNNINEVTDVQIQAGSDDATSAAVRGYRSTFIGVIRTDGDLTSASIRALTNKGRYSSSFKETVTAGEGAKKIIVAIPSAPATGTINGSINGTRKGVSSVILKSAMDTPITDKYTRYEKFIKVYGTTESTTAVDYDLWVYAPASIDAGEVHEITLA